MTIKCEREDIVLKIPEKINRPYTSRDVSEMNKVYSSCIVSSSNANALNRITSDTSAQNTANAVHNAPRQNAAQNTENAFQNTPRQTAPPAVNKPMPSFSKPLKKGMKVPLFPQGNISPLKAGIGWRINDSRCDVDVSAFLLGMNEKVISEDWFVFYSQPQSPDRSIVYNMSDPVYQKSFDIDLSRLNSDVQKIVFVVTIDEALKKALNFGMLEDVYLKLTDVSGNELLSFCLTDYYSNVTSMMLGELYRNKGQWKFSAIGNGIARDLEGLCNFYGIEVI